MWSASIEVLKSFGSRKLGLRRSAGNFCGVGLHGGDDVVALPGGQPETAYTDGGCGAGRLGWLSTSSEAPCQPRSKNFRLDTIPFLFISHLKMFEYNIC